jgi:hypothetical protein
MFDGEVLSSFNAVFSTYHDAKRGSRVAPCPLSGPPVSTTRRERRGLWLGRCSATAKNDEWDRTERLDGKIEGVAA